MNWIFEKIITNKWISWGIYISMFLLVITDLLIENLIDNPKDIISINFYFALFIIMGIYEILRKWFKKLYYKNKTILESVSDLLKKENLNELIIELEKIKIIKNQLIQKVYWRGVAKTYLGDSNSAIEDFEQIYNDYKNFPDYNYHKAIAYKDIGEYEQALELFNLSIKIKPNAQTFDQRGVTYMIMDRMDDAENDFIKSLKFKEDYYNLVNYGVFLVKKGDVNKAIDCFDKSLQIRPDNSNGLQNRGYCKYKMGDIENGLIDLKRASELGNEQAKRILEEIDNK